MTFADYLKDIFSPAFNSVAEWFQQLLDETGFFGVFLSLVVLTIAFSALVMPFLRFGGLGMIASGSARLEAKNARNQAKKDSKAWKETVTYRPIHTSSGVWYQKSTSYSRSRRM